MASIHIQGGELFDPTSPEPTRGDLYLVDGKITRDKPASIDQTIDASGKWVTPGLIDIHVHFREPGQEGKETISTGAAAAVAGGFTTVCCMPNTIPALDNAAWMEFVYSEAKKAGLANVWPVGCLTKGRAGTELAEMATMWERGAVAFSDDGTGVADAALMHKALQYCKMLGAPIMQHCEEPSLSGGCMNAGDVSAELGLPGILSESEELMIARDVGLNRRVGCKYHVQHISSAWSVELIRRAKADGQPVTAEAAPHHLLLTDEACRGYDTNYKMNPPLRTQADVDAVIAGVVDGTIDLLATDHAPHTAEDKNRPMQEAAFGILGLECAFGLYKKALVDAGHISPMRLIEMMTIANEKVVALPDGRGSLAEGSVADVTIIDPDLQWTVDSNQFKSKSRNCPFDGWELKGRPTHTIVGGKLCWTLK